MKEENKIKYKKNSMKKIFTVIALSLMCAASFGQFIYKVVDNGFDEPFKKAICYSTSNSPDKGLLCLEEDGRWPFLYIAGSYFCGDECVVDISFNNGNRYRILGKTSESNKTLYLDVPIIQEKYDSLGCPIYNPSVGLPDTLLWDGLFEDIRKCSTIIKKSFFIR